MKYLIICDPSGAYSARFIERGVSPDDIYVYEDTHKGAVCAQSRGAHFISNLSDVKDMLFDVIIGNPPYQRPKHKAGNHNNKPLWLEFIIKSNELLKDGGTLSLLVPGQVAKSTQWDKKGKGFTYLEGMNITHIHTGCGEHFNVGTTISRVIAVKGQPQGNITINNEFEVDISQRPWLPVIQHPAAYSILDKVSSLSNRFHFVLQANSKDNKHNHGATTSVGMYRLNQYYGYDCSVRQDRKDKNLMWIGMECDTEVQAQVIVQLMRSKLFTAIRRVLFYEPNYANGILNGMTYADIVALTDEGIYEQYGLTQDEIDFVESLSKPAKK